MPLGAYASGICAMSSTNSLSSPLQVDPPHLEGSGRDCECRYHRQVPGHDGEDVRFDLDDARERGLVGPGVDGGRSVICSVREGVDLPQRGLGVDDRGQDPAVGPHGQVLDPGPVGEFPYRRGRDVVSCMPRERCSVDSAEAEEGGCLEKVAQADHGGSGSEKYST